VATGAESDLVRRAEYLLLLGLLACFVRWGLIPAWRSLNTDFPGYYLAARLYRQGYSLERAYDWVWFQRQKDHAGIEQPLVTFTGYPPDCILPVLPFSSLPPLAAKRCWLVLNLILLGVDILLLNSIVSIGPRRLAIVAFLALDALRTNFLFGQEHLLIASLLALAAYFYFRGAKASAGAILACGAALKIYPAFFLFYFVRKKQWRAIAGLALCSLGLALLSLALFGYETLRYYILDVLPRALAGEVIDPYDANWGSFTALLRRTFISEPELNPHPWVHMPAAYAVLQPLCQALLFVPTLWAITSARVAPAKEKLEWGAYVVLLLILSSAPAPYHFCALIVAAALAVNYFLAMGQKGRACFLVAVYGLLCFPARQVWAASSSAWQAFPAYRRLGALTVLWAFLLWALASGHPKGLRARLKSREAAAFALLMLALVTVGVLSNLRHARGLLANYSTRIVTGTESTVAAEPAAAGERVFFTTMLRSGYTIASWERGSVNTCAFGSDAFHPAASAAGETWVELASLSSRIVRAPLDGRGFDPGRISVEAEDAEQPAVSPDGTRLAFIREKRGRGSLWIKAVIVESDNRRIWGTESLAVGDEYGVLEAAFAPDDRIIFSARPATTAALFALDLRSRRISTLSDSSRPTRYPAVSADGQWLAYSQEEMGNWQLWVMRFSTAEKHKMTESDCNSISPAWFADSKTLVYATDCGRGVGLTALCQVRAVR